MLFLGLFSKSVMFPPMTPLMKQYWDIKSLHEDKILLFRMGDFFEMFFDDAVKAAPVMGIALTSRNKKSQDETPMCGVPHHSIGGHINKLLGHGYKVAICDQIEDPKQAKGLVKRAVTRILTPGMVYDPDQLNPVLANYIACYDQQTLALVDPSTGEAFYFDPVELSRAKRLLMSLPIVELIFIGGDRWTSFDGTCTDVKFYDQNEPDTKTYDDPTSCQALREYVISLAPEQKDILRPFERRSLATRMELSQNTLRHLEIFQNNNGDSQGSLFAAIDRTKTSVGARRLRSWIQFPLVDVKEISFRQDQIESWVHRPGMLKVLRDLLFKTGDLERRFSKISVAQSHVRDLQSLASSLVAAAEVNQKADLGLDVSSVLDWAQQIEKVFIQEAPISTRQGGLINKGVYPELDELIELSENSSELLRKMEERERQHTQIGSLKIRYNNVFGYYIEVTNTHKDKVPTHYLRKQTLANAERYYTEELLDLEKKVLSAQTKRNDFEYGIFEKFKSDILKQAEVVLSLASELAHLDCVTGLAFLAIERSYCRPILGGNEIKLQASRHPVVEQALNKLFISNDVHMPARSTMLLTGPNMAGKSTLMRQVGLICLLAQIGSFVPAASAEVPVFQQLFTRIGAQDQLSEGLSTFMVEMTETADILKNVKHNSLVILDEIGRGTSTYDGMSLAQAILEYLVVEKGCLTLFATHYHELTSLAYKYPQIMNAHMRVAERGGQISFLHSLTQGPAQKSYGIHVAKLAGLPDAVIKSASKILKSLESKAYALDESEQMSLLSINSNMNSGEINCSEANSSEANSHEIDSYQVSDLVIETGSSSKSYVEPAWMAELKNLDLNQMTPMQALQTLQNLQIQHKQHSQ